MAGELRLTGSDRTYRMVLFDANADGDYANDPLVIDVNGDGKAGETERVTVGKQIRIEQRDVILRAIAASGRSVTLQD